MITAAPTATADLALLRDLVRGDRHLRTLFITSLTAMVLVLVSLPLVGDPSAHSGITFVLAGIPLGLCARGILDLTRRIRRYEASIRQATLEPTHALGSTPT